MYIENEAVGHIDIDLVPDLFDTINDCEARNYTIQADSARPDMISYMRRHGYTKMRAVKKWPESITAGISTIRSFDEVVIHPSCKNALDNFKNYSWKLDKLSKTVLPVPVDAYCDSIDALRYALVPITLGKFKSKSVPTTEESDYKYVERKNSWLV